MTNDGESKNHQPKPVQPGHYENRPVNPRVIVPRQRQMGSNPPVAPYRPAIARNPAPQTISPSLPPISEPIPQPAPAAAYQPQTAQAAQASKSTRTAPSPPPPRTRHVPPINPSVRRTKVDAPVQPAPLKPPKPPKPPKSRRLPTFRLPSSWQFWSILAVLLFTGTGVLALALLLKLPALPNCPKIFWPTASASLRLYCAELAANKQTVNDLLTAIALVDSLPADHPLRPEINSNIEKWALAILELAEEKFQAGDLDEAIAVVQKIPANTTAHQQIEDRIKRWRSIWADAEKIYKDAEQAMLDEDLQSAFSISTRLLSVGNTYWATTKYQELTDLITASREDGNKLSDANRLARRGGLSNLLEAIKMAGEISPKSPAYAAAQRLIGEFGKQMFDLAEATLEAGDSERAIAIARQIPEQADMEKDVQDFINLAIAEAQAWDGAVADLEAAIVQAQRVSSDRPLYDRAQELIRRWQLEIQGVNHIELAQQIAANGGIENLPAAIAEAQAVPASNPRYDEAQDLINEWSRRIETSEDQPYLDEAEALAQGGNVSALQAAINQASRIREGRALYSEAQQHIREWTSRVQHIQDQPYLDEARRLANAGNLPAAIATAEQIQSGRALYEDAQSEIRTWRARTEGQSRLQSAYDLASVATPSNLLSAIQTASQIPRSSPARAEADRMINVWSQQMLEIAQQQASQDLQSAIAIAASIPPRTEAYAAAQLQIQSWQQSQGTLTEEGTEERQ